MFNFKRKRAVPAFGDMAAEDDQDIEAQRPEAYGRTSFWTETRLLVRDLLFALMFAALFVVFVVQPVKVEGTSMLPRLHDGERIFVNKLVYYGVPNLTRGDIVVFWYPNDPSKSYIKRVIGLPNETVEVRDWRVYINGQQLAETYLDPESNKGLQSRSMPCMQVPAHYYFVMGDNRDASSDSRYWGYVPEKYIYGKALLRYWPLSTMTTITHESAYNLPTPVPPGPQCPKFQNPHFQQ